MSDLDGKPTEKPGDSGTGPRLHPNFAAYPGTPSQESVRDRGLGHFAVLADWFAFKKFFRKFDIETLLKCALVSKSFYVFSTEDEIWKQMCIKKHDGNWTFNQNWKLTTLQPGRNKQRTDPCPRLSVEGFDSAFFYQRWYRAHVDLKHFLNGKEDIDRVENISYEVFKNEYEAKNKPVIMSGLADDWPAKTEWTRENLLEKYGDRLVKTDEPDDYGGKLKMKLRDYLTYCDQQHDEDPTYWFDPAYHKPGRITEMLGDYKVPDIFQEDFFSLLELNARPHFRWIVCGPERTGAPFHIDPYHTSAWNALLRGRKRWALYPPNIMPPGTTWTTDKHGEVDFDTPEPVKWFIEQGLPLFAGPSDHDYPAPLEFTQLPGDIIFVPSGWWHQVLNLEFSIAVTQNFWDSYNFFAVFRDLSHPANRSLNRDVRKRLGEERPDLLALGDIAMREWPAHEDLDHVPVPPKPHS